MPPSSAVAFAPAAITNFFRIQYDSHGTAPIGATGGGYVLSKGTTTKASLTPGDTCRLFTIVNGSADYDARTTRRAVQMLLSANESKFGELVLDQKVATPIGSGFGASAASAVSGVFAAAAVLGISAPKRELAIHAHRAEIIEQTGLGTVPVTFDGVGAGAITVPGIPGKAEFTTVRIPKRTRIVTGYIAPYDKREALSSKTISQRINRLGEESLRAFLADPTLDTLASEGERFSRRLGLESPEVKKLQSVARKAGATHASQNMIGHAIHAITDVDTSKKVERALAASGLGPRIDTFEVGSERAHAKAD